MKAGVGSIGWTEKKLLFWRLTGCELDAIILYCIAYTFGFTEVGDARQGFPTTFGAAKHDAVMFPWIHGRPFMSAMKREATRRIERCDELTTMALLLSLVFTLGLTASVPAAAITVISPNGGETWSKGTSPEITWSADTTLVGANVKILLYKGNTLYRTIAAQWSSKSGSFPYFTVPYDYITGTDYKVKIVSTTNDSFYDLSDGYFEIKDRPPYIEITAPNGGEEWVHTLNHTIRWTSGSVNSNVRIELYKGAVFKQTIVDSTPCNGSYTWPIPESVGIGSDYKIKIASTLDADLNDSSDDDFTIRAVKKITVTSPNGGEVWERLRTYPITWSSSGDVGSDVRIDLLSGQVSRLLVASTTNDGSWDWSIDSSVTPNSGYTIRVRSTTTGFYGSSDSTFTIEKEKGGYTLTVNSDGASGVDISSTTGHGGTTNYTRMVPSGTSVSLTAPATAAGKAFTGWTGDVPNASRTISFSMNTSKTVTANYETTTTNYTLTVNSDGVSGVAITSSTGHGGTTNYTRAVPSGTTVSLTAPASANDKILTRWMGSVVDGNPTINFTMDSDKTVTAYYGNNAVTITSCTISDTTPNPGQPVTLSDTAGQVHGADFSDIVKVVIGFRDGSGHWAGGNPVVISTTMPGRDWQPWSGSSATITAPSTAGTYHVWVRCVSTQNESLAIQQFKDITPWSDSPTERNSRWGTPIVPSAVHAVSAPSTPTGGPEGGSGFSDTTYTFSTAGGSCNGGHSVQYQFDWGDGIHSEWSASSSASYRWPRTGGDFAIRARARCSSDTSIVSAWSGALSVYMAPYTGFHSDPIGAKLYRNGNLAATTPYGSYLWKAGDEAKLTKDGYEDHTFTLSASDIGKQHTIILVPLATFTLTLSSTNGGYVAAPGEGVFTYTSGETVRLEAEADPGYSFTGWSGNFSSGSNPVDLSVDHDYEITANFEEGYLASGRVTDEEGRGIGYVRIDFEFADGRTAHESVFTNYDGYWAQSGFTTGSEYMVRPDVSQPGQSYRFSPECRDFSAVEETTELDFVAEICSTSGVHLLTVPHLWQGSSYWCAFTSLAMCAQHFGVNLKPENVAQYFNAGYEEGIRTALEADQRWFEWTGLTQDDIRVFLNSYGLSWGPLAVPTFNGMKDAIDAGTPLLQCTQNHAVVLVGYDDAPGTEAIFIHDPALSAGSYIRMCVSEFFREYSGPSFVLYPLDELEAVEGHPVVQFINPVIEQGSEYYFLNNMSTSTAGAEISKNAGAIRISCRVSDQGKEQRPNTLRPPSDYVVQLKIYNAEGLTTQRDVELNDFEPGTGRIVHIGVESTELETWTDGTYDLYVDLLKEDLSSIYDSVGPFAFSLCSYRSQDPYIETSPGTIEKHYPRFLSNISLLGARAAPGDLLLYRTICDISADCSGNVRVYDSGWDWSSGFDALAIDVSSGDLLENTGKDRLEFKVQVESADGTVFFSFDECPWTTTDTDGDGFYGDYSGHGGSVPRVESPQRYPGVPPQGLSFYIKVRVQLDGRSTWHEGPAIHVGSIVATGN